MQWKVHCYCQECVRLSKSGPTINEQAKWGRLEKELNKLRYEYHMAHRLMMQVP